MIHTDEPPAVDLYAVLADDRVVETLGSAGPRPTPETWSTMLARWRDMCRGTGSHRAA